MSEEFEVDVGLSFCSFVEDLNDFLWCIYAGDTNLRRNTVQIFEGEFDQFSDRQADICFRGECNAKSPLPGHKNHEASDTRQQGCSIYKPTPPLA